MTVSITNVSTSAGTVSGYNYSYPSITTVAGNYYILTVNFANSYYSTPGSGCTATAAPGCNAWTLITSVTYNNAADGCYNQEYVFAALCNTSSSGGFTISSSALSSTYLIASVEQVVGAQSVGAISNSNTGANSPVSVLLTGTSSVTFFAGSVTGANSSTGGSYPSVSTPIYGFTTLGALSNTNGYSALLTGYSPTNVESASLTWSGVSNSAAGVIMIGITAAAPTTFNVGNIISTKYIM
jgi:hypothetical protein